MRGSLACLFKDHSFSLEVPRIFSETLHFPCYSLTHKDHGPSPVAAGPMKAATIWRRWILPVAVLGSLSVKNTLLGTCVRNQSYVF